MSRQERLGTTIPNPVDLQHPPFGPFSSAFHSFTSFDENVVDHSPTPVHAAIFGPATECRARPLHHAARHGWSDAGMYLGRRGAIGTDWAGRTGARAISCQRRFCLSASIGSAPREGFERVLSSAA